MMKSSSYWEKRQVQDAFNTFQKAEDTADQIASLYQKASRYLSLQADDIFERYQTKHRLSEAEARRLINTLQDRTSLDELLQKLRNGDKDESKRQLLSQLEAPAYQARIERLRQMQNQLDLIIRNIYQQEKEFSTSFYTDLANESYYRSIYNIQQRADAAFSFGHVSAKVIDKVINSRWSGKNYSERIWGNTQALAQDLKEELLINLMSGRTSREAAAIIANKFAQASSNARRLVWTESNYVSTELNFKAYEECGIEEYQYLATLDLRTSKICRELDGKIYPIKERQIGKNCPPMHPWCRSTTISVVDRSLIEKMQRSAIDPATGKRIKVPRSMTYQQWYDKYVKGKPEVELEENKIRNRSSDRTQYRKYREILRKDVPETLDDFQNMKYNDINRWDSLHTKYLDANLKAKIQSDVTNKLIESGKQGKHIIGHNNYVKGRSYLTVSLEEAQRLVYKYAGTGELKRDRFGKWTNKEFVSAEKDVGVVVDPQTGEEFVTSRFSIHYSKNGTHIVPRKEG
ncbi:polymorphic toxin type 50 domain-containing protein [Blautia producta]|uniref:polymorphic toxin type 50 domain-containing protein n=1 Tax=Blautia producta TaxID=33035 RepID=UPI0004B59791